MAMVPWLLVVLAVVLGLWALIAGAFGWTTGRRVEVDCCGKCRYPIAGLSAATCPECGGDLVGKGVLRARECSRRQAPLVVTLVCRSIIAAGVLLGAWALIGEAYPETRSVADGRWTLRPLVERVSLTVRAVAFEAGATAMGTGIRRSPLKATIEYDDGRRFAFRFEAGSADERFDGDPAPRETMFDLADVERWLTTAGIDAGAESASGLAQDVTLVLINAACGGELPQDLPTLRSAGVWTSRTVWPARWLVGAVVGPGLMLWVLWMRETIRARRRLRRTAPAALGAA